jgi:hypothetical protein
MGQILNSKENELYKRTDEVLFYIWDPIGVSHEPYARDEYFSYLPQVFQMLLNEKPKEMIVEYLLKIVSERMELNPDIEHAKEVVEVLEEYKEKIFNN